MSKPFPVSRSRLPGLIAAVTLSLMATSAEAVIFEPPEDQAPDSTLGGGARNPQQCVSVQEGLSPITPLLPKTQIGFTVAERPTIYIYVPQISAQQIFFSLQTETGEQHFQHQMKLPETPGIIGVQLPEDAPPLKENVNYRWRMAFICGEALEPDSPEYVGWVRRLPREEYSISSELSLKKVQDLAQAKLWYDTIFSLVQLKKQEPDNLSLIENWTELLSSVGLEAIANQPILKSQP